jgi:hypothetical protein
MSPWSPQQREWLQAMGHDVLVLAGAEAKAELAAPPSERPLPAPRAPRSPTVTAAGDSPMLRALLRAAGRRDLGDLQWLPDPATLRGDAAAKRALWPRLRTLRRKPADA